MSSNTVRSILESAIQRFIKVGCDTPRLDAEVLLAHALNQDRAWLYTHPQEILNPAQLNHFFDLVNRRERREPVAYLTGHKEFFGLDFQVNRHALIPRPETELLVEFAIQLSKTNAQFSKTNAQLSKTNAQFSKTNAQFSKTDAQLSRTDAQLSTVSTQLSTPASARPRHETPISMADIGTGSGCIAIALAKNVTAANIFAVDISAEALEIAQQNAHRHGVAGRITFLLGDLLHALPTPVDLIVSNPPYVSDSELRAASPEVRQYEPPLALNGGQDGLEIIRQLLPQAKEKLKPGGSLLVEIGAAQRPSVVSLAQEYFPGATIQIKQDLAGLDRLLVIVS